ncbi:hypothetical protein BDQ17DRAFT_721067 [Cyathus striatus]|nr:hypothetical protein BDQ17DRAFT_721067 [Cyathus striatus]
MIILEEDASTSGERSPLKSPGSNPNVIMSPVERAPESSNILPPPPYGSTSAAAAPSAATQRDAYPHEDLRKLFVPAPYTRRTLGRFLYAFFVAMLVLTASTVFVEKVISAINEIDNSKRPPRRDRDRDRPWDPSRRNHEDREDHEDRRWTREGIPEDFMTELNKECLGRDSAAERRLPMQYPPKRLRCVHEGVDGEANVGLDDLS